jgi:glycosyltransferase involved in cell wall biosynthesis
MHKSLQFDELCALYAVSDVCLVSSTRDGMNLVSYEYIACQQARQGALIISEFAGAAQSLNGSIVVNPWDSQQVADAIHEAVTMDSETRAENHKKLYKVLFIRFFLLRSDYCSRMSFIAVREQVLGRILGYELRPGDGQVEPRGGAEEARGGGRINRPI